MKSILLLFIMFLSMNAWAKKVKGLLIEQGDTTQVVFNIPVELFGSVSMEKIYNGLKLKRHRKKEVLVPKRGIEIVFTMDSKNYHFTSMPNYGFNHYPLFGKPGFQHRMGFMQTFYSSENIK